MSISAKGMTTSTSQPVSVVTYRDFPRKSFVKKLVIAGEDRDTVDNVYNLSVFTLQRLIAKNLPNVPAQYHDEVTISGPSDTSDTWTLYWSEAETDADYTARWTRYQSERS